MSDMEFIHIGYGSMVSRGMLIDATYGRKTASIFIMDSDHVILSALPPEKFGGQLCDKEDA